MSTAKRRRAAPGTAELRAVRRDELFDEAGNSDGDNSGSDGEEVAQVDAGLDNDDSDSADFDVDIDQLLDKEKLKALAKKELAGIARPPKRKRGSEQVEAHAAPEVAPIKESLSIIKRIKPSKSAEPAKSAPAVANGQPAASTPTEQSFADLGLSKWLTDTLAQLGIKTPSEIQKACIPPTLQGELFFHWCLSKANGGLQSGVTKKHLYAT